MNDMKTMDDYIKMQTEDIQALLYQIRDTLRKALPDSEEKIS